MSRKFLERTLNFLFESILLLKEEMSNDQDENEQITKNPLPAKSGIKEKDPKKVAAGRKLAEYHKEAKKHDGDSNKIWLPETSLTSIIALLGIGRFLRYKSQRYSDLPPQTKHRME